jgi:hypothetical protein
MAVVKRQGWELNDPNVSKRQYRATLGAVDLSTGPRSGNTEPIVVVNNIATGTFDYYKPTGPFLGSPFASYSPAQDKVIPKNQSLFNTYFDQNTNAGRTQLKTITDSAKLATFDLATLNSTLDPIDRQNFQNLQNLKGYQSLANQRPVGGRVPGATPSSTPNPQQSGTENPPPTAPTTEFTIDPEKLSRVSGRNVRPNYGDPRNLRYPSNINAGRDKQDVIQFTMYEYTPPNSFTLTSGNTFKKNPQLGEGKRRGTVTLPIQPTIVDSNSVNWQQDSINPMELAALNMSTGFISDGEQGLGEALNAVTSSLGAEAGNVKNVVLAALMSAAIGKNIVGRTTGAILNPNVELLFNGPSLRVFNYSFKLSARSGPESKNIQRIIRFFKQGMSVQRSEAELFLVTPDIFTIRYLFKEGPDHPYINRIKVCALTNCSVDYTPTGSYMTFQDGAMVSYTMNLTFEELEPVYHDDYDELEENQIGF